MDTISIEIRRFNINQSNDNIEISNHQAFSSKNNILTSGRSPINGRILIKTPEYGIIEEEKYKYGREIHLLAQIRHKNIIPFLGICEIERMTYCVVIEYMEGTSLHEVMRKGEQYSQRHVYSWVYQAARALSYLHTLLIAHLDIKPQNLLIDPDRKIVKLCDFDSAIKMDVGKPVDLTTCSFTNYFLDTNVKPGEVSVSRVLSMDIYSLAVTTWVILQKPVKITLKNDEGYRPDSITADIPSKLIDTKVITDPETAEFIESAWDSDAEKRPSACQFRIFMRKKKK